MIKINIFDIIFSILIIYCIYLISYNKKYNIPNNIDKFTDNPEKVLRDSIKILTKLSKTILINDSLNIPTNGNIIFNKEIETNSINVLVNTGEHNNAIIDKDIEFIPVGTIISFSGDFTNIPQAWALCDGRYYLYSSYDISNKDKINILKEYQISELKLPNLDKLTDEFILSNLEDKEIKNKFTKTPNLIGRTVYGTNGNDYNYNFGETSTMINHFQMPAHQHKTFLITKDRAETDTNISFNNLNKIENHLTKWTDLSDDKKKKHQSLKSIHSKNKTSIPWTPDFPENNDSVIITVLPNRYEAINVNDYSNDIIKKEKLKKFLCNTYGKNQVPDNKKNYNDEIDKMNTFLEEQKKKVEEEGEETIDEKEDGTKCLSEIKNEKFRFQKEINIMPNSVALYWIIKI